MFMVLPLWCPRFLIFPKFLELLCTEMDSLSCQVNLVHWFPQVDSRGHNSYCKLSYHGSGLSLAMVTTIWAQLSGNGHENEGHTGSVRPSSPPKRTLSLIVPFFALLLWDFPFWALIHSECSFGKQTCSWCHFAQLNTAQVGWNSAITCVLKKKAGVDFGDDLIGYYTDTFHTHGALSVHSVPQSPQSELSFDRG